MAYLQINDNLFLDLDEVVTGDINTDQGEITLKNGQTVILNTRDAIVIRDLIELRGHLLKLDEIYANSAGLEQLLDYCRQSKVRHPLIELLKNPKDTIKRIEIGIQQEQMAFNFDYGNIPGENIN